MSEQDDNRQTEGGSGKRTIGAALGVSMFLAAGISGVEAEAPAPAPTIFAGQPPPGTELSPGSPEFRAELRRQQIRETLLEQSRRNFARVAPLAENGYSHDLAALQSRLTATVRQNDGQVYNQVVVLDPRKFDAGMALGMDKQTIVSGMMSAQGAVPDTTVTGPAAQKMAGQSVYTFGAATYTQDPSALWNPDRTSPQACVIVPSSEGAYAIDIKGMTREQELEFLNRHESWHCLDSRYSLRGLDKGEMDKFEAATTMEEKLAHRDGLTGLATLIKKESFADAGALGDMIRGGQPVDLIDKVSDFRAGRPGDALHMSPPVLQGLKDRINQMGVENFRKLSDAQARQVYFDVTDKNGPTAKSLETAFRYEQANAFQRFGYIIDAQSDPEVRKGIDFEQLANAAVPAAVPTPDDVTRDYGIRLQVDAWRANQQLQDRAFAMAGKITPETMTKAYGAIQDDLHNAQKRDPNNPLYAAQATRLQQAFVYDVQNLDYEAVNAARGVKITAAEASLKQFSDPGRPTMTAKPGHGPAPRS